MHRVKSLVLNTVLLTASSFVMRFVGMAFQVYLTKKLGASGIGLFQLILSIYTLFTTLAISGIRFATTRLLSEKLGEHPECDISSVIRKCLMYAFIAGSVSFLLLSVFAESIAVSWIKDSRAFLSLRVLALSLPFLSMSSVLSGYFTAVGRVIKSAVSQFAEQLARIITVLIFYTFHASADIAVSCAVIMAGGALGDVVSFTMQYIFYHFDKKRFTKKYTHRGVTLRLFRIAFPLALSSYARTALSTLQQLLVPRGFEKHGASGDQALADYGMIQGMALPIIMFPSALVYSLAEVIVPFLTDAQVNGDKKRTAALADRALLICFMFAAIVSSVIFRYSSELSRLLYDNDLAAKFIRIFALLVPVMYLDSITDGILRGLGKQMYCMWVNIGDSVTSVILVYFLLPKYALAGYVFMICFTEIVNFAFSYYKLKKSADIRLKLRDIILSAFSALGAVSIAEMLLNSISLHHANTPFTLAVHILLTVIIYILLVLILTDKLDIIKRKHMKRRSHERIQTDFR